MKQKIPSSWKFTVAAFVALNFLFSATALAFGMPNNELNSTVGSFKAVDGKDLTARSSTTFFHFMAYGLCSRTTDQCIEISGSGSVRHSDELRASGHFIKYDKEAVKQIAIGSHYGWIGKELVNANAIRVHFKAMTGLGIIDIAVTEGKTPTSGLVCIWGTLDGVTGPNETLCTNNVTVYVS
jgi:hypothetical protein